MPVSQRFRGVLVLAAAALVGAGLAAPAASGTGVPPSDGWSHRSGDVRVIVRTRPLAKGTMERSRAATQVRAAGGTLHHVYRSALEGYSATMPAKRIPELLVDPSVVSVDEDQPVYAARVQEPIPSWGLDRIDQRALPLSSSYGYDTTGQGVTVYVFDTGVRLSHEEFRDRIETGPDFVDRDASSDDCHGHGTHVAGTVGGSSFGVAKDVKLVAVRVLGCDGTGSYSQLIEAIDWINADHADGVPAVVNASVGGGFYDPMNAAVESSIADGVAWVVAAHNHADDACRYSPGSTAAAITVAATSADDSRAGFSNFGDCVDIFAPGVNITSAGLLG